MSCSWQAFQPLARLLRLLAAKAPQGEPETFCLRRRPFRSPPPSNAQRIIPLTTRAASSHHLTGLNPC